MKILVIGKKGYISSCFQNYMRQYYPQTQVDAISARNEAWKNADFRGYDAVFNTTGLAHNDARKGTEEEFLALNAELPLYLAEKAKKEGVSTFVHMSSMIVYGNMTPIGSIEPISASTVATPANIYGRSKRMGEENIQRLENDSFHVAIIRSPLVYGEDAVDNFLALTNYAVRLPIFPYVENARSMIYFENLCELVRLIAENRCGGIFYPQQEEYICTSKIVKDLAEKVGHKIWMPKIFNPVLKQLSKRNGVVRRVFGSLAYDMNLSDHFGGAYRIVSYPESVDRIAKAKNNKK